MVRFLSFFATLVNLVGLAVSLCLGLYLVTRTLRSRLSWLAALTLWSVTGFFLHNALVIGLPGSGMLPWLRPVVALALAFGFHLTLLLPPERGRPAIEFFLPPLRLPGSLWQRLQGRRPTLCRLAVPLAYGLASILLIAGVFPIGSPSEDVVDSAVYLSDRVAGPLYPLSIPYLLVFGSLAFLHLWQGREQAPGPRHKGRYNPPLAAVVMTVLGGLYLSVGAWLGLRLPSFPGDATVGMAAVIFGYTVARHNALVEGIAIKRDLLYISVTIGSFTIFYLIVAEILYLGGHTFSPLTLILLVVVAISSLMLYDGLRTTLDRFFYREQFRQLRANLRALAREAGVGQSLPDRLQAILDALCRTLEIRRGFVSLKQGEAFVCEATVRAELVGRQFPVSVLEASDIEYLPRPGDTRPEGMVLLLPIHDADAQIGALALGPKETGQPYSEEDLILLDDLADQLASVIQATSFQEKNALAISEMVADFRDREHALQRQVQQMLAEREEQARPVLAGVDEKEFVSLVEDALRRLHDFPYLGEHPLAQLSVVDWHLAGREAGFVTHLDRGKALSEVVVQALHKLRPEGAEPGSQTVAPREWHQFITLHDAYVLDELNRDIMSRLYVGEGTFNRTRRRALRGVAKALQEMEREAQQGEHP